MSDYISLRHSFDRSGSGTGGITNGGARGYCVASYFPSSKFLLLEFWWRLTVRAKFVAACPLRLNGRIVLCVCEPSR
jgi:hypothetical protein